MSTVKVERNPYLVISSPEPAADISPEEVEKLSEEMTEIGSEEDGDQTRKDIMSIEEFVAFIGEKTKVPNANEHLLQTWLDKKDLVADLPDFQGGRYLSTNIIAPRLKLFLRWLQFLLITVMHLVDKTHQKYNQVLENMIIIYAGFYPRHGKLPDLFETLDILRGKNSGQNLPHGPHLILVDPHANASHFEVPDDYQNLTTVVQAKLNDVKMQKVNEAWEKSKKNSNHEVHVVLFTDCRSDVPDYEMIDEHRRLLMLTMGKLAELQSSADMSAHKGDINYLLQQAAFLTMSSSELSQQVEVCINADNQAQAKWGSLSVVGAWSGKLHIPYPTLLLEWYPSEQVYFKNTKLGVPTVMEDYTRHNSTEVNPIAIKKDNEPIAIKTDATVKKIVAELKKEITACISLRDRLNNQWYKSDRPHSIKTHATNLTVNAYTDDTYFNVESKKYNLETIDKVCCHMNTDDACNKRRILTEAIVQGLLTTYCESYCKPTTDYSVKLKKTDTYRAVTHQLHGWSKRTKSKQCTKQRGLQEGSTPGGSLYFSMLHSAVNCEWDKLMKTLNSDMNMKQIQDHLSFIVFTSKASNQIYKRILTFFRVAQNPFFKRPVYYSKHDLPSVASSQMSDELKQATLSVLSSTDVVGKIWSIVAWHANAHFRSIKEPEYYRVFLQNNIGHKHFGDTEHPMLQNQTTFGMALNLKVIFEHFFMANGKNQDLDLKSQLTNSLEIDQLFSLVVRGMDTKLHVDHNHKEFTYFALVTSIFMLINAFNMSGLSSVDVEAISRTRKVMSDIAHNMIQEMNLNQSKLPCYPMSISRYHTGLTENVRPVLMNNIDFVAQFYFYVLPCLPQDMTLQDFKANYDSILAINKNGSVSSFVRDLNSDTGSTKRSIFEWPGITTAQQMTSTPKVLKEAVVHTFITDPTKFSKRLRFKSTNGLNLLAKAVYLGNLDLINFLQVTNDTARDLFENHSKFVEFKDTMLDLWDPELLSTYYVVESQTYVNMIQDTKNRIEEARQSGSDNVLISKSYPYNTDVDTIDKTTLEHIEVLLVNYQARKFKHYYENASSKFTRGFPFHYTFPNGYQMSKPVCVSYYWSKHIFKTVSEKILISDMLPDNITFVDYDTRQGENVWFLACLCPSAKFICLSNPGPDENRQTTWEVNKKRLSDEAYQTKPTRIERKSMSLSAEDLQEAEGIVLLVDCCSDSDFNRANSRVEEACATSGAYTQLFVLLKTGISKSRSTQLTQIYLPDAFAGWTSHHIGPEDSNDATYTCLFSSNI